jgi:hypothetical protein
MPEVIYDFTDNPRGSPYQFYLTSDFVSPSHMLELNKIVEVDDVEYISTYNDFDMYVTYYTKLNHFKITKGSKIFIKLYKYNEKTSKMIFYKEIMQYSGAKNSNSHIDYTQMAKHFAPELFI